MSNPLWDYAVAVYGLDEVAPTCLELQDRFHLDVNILLYGSWLASMDRRLSPEHLHEVVALVAPWRLRTVEPLRALRRELRGYPPANALREQIKVLELGAERQQQDMMYEFYQGQDEFSRTYLPLGENLALVVEMASPGDDAWEPAIARLISLISSDSGVA